MPASPVSRKAFTCCPPINCCAPGASRPSSRGVPWTWPIDSGKRILAVLNTRSVLLLDGSTGTRIAEIAAQSHFVYRASRSVPATASCGSARPRATVPTALPLFPLSELGMPGKVERIELPGHPLPAGIAFSADGKTGLRGIQPQQHAGRDRHGDAPASRRRSSRGGAVRRSGRQRPGRDLRLQPRRAPAPGRRHHRAFERLRGSHRPGDRIVHHRHGHGGGCRDLRLARRSTVGPGSLPRSCSRRTARRCSWPTATPIPSP